MSASPHIPYAVKRWQVTALFMIGMFAVLLMALRSEVNSSGIHENAQRIAQATHASCVDNRAQLAKVNTLRLDIIAIESAHPDSSSAARIDAYRRSLMTLPDCTRAP